MGGNETYASRHGGQGIGLLELHSNLEIGENCALKTYSGVEFAVSENSMLPIPADGEGLGMPDAQGSLKLLGRMIGCSPEVRSSNAYKGSHPLLDMQVIS